MNKALTLLAICVIQLIFNFTAFAQEFELTPRIPVQASGNKSAVVIKNQSPEVRIGNAISKENILKTGTTSQIIS